MRMTTRKASARPKCLHRAGSDGASGTATRWRSTTLATLHLSALIEHPSAADRWSCPGGPYGEDSRHCGLTMPERLIARYWSLRVNWLMPSFILLPKFCTN